MASLKKTGHTLLIGYSILLFLQTLTSIVKSVEATKDGQIVVYWGQNAEDDTLSSTCESKLYDIVVISFLNQFGCDKALGLNLNKKYCPEGDCTGLQNDIRRCQKSGVKVFLSLGGPSGDYSLCSSDDAKNVAKSLYKEFLSNQKGLLGTVALDGIDFRIGSQTASPSYWDDLAKALDNNRKLQDIDYLLSAAPRCTIPDAYLDAAIKTNVFDQLFIQFYNNPRCQYSRDYPEALEDSWKAWTNYVQVSTKVFLGLPAVQVAAPNGGYIPPSELNSQVLSSYAKQAPNYGGVALWDRGYDKKTNYASTIKPYVPKKPALLSFISKNIEQHYCS